MLTHPDMDHMDGFNAMVNRFGVDNFWDTGSRRDKPSFNGSPFYEEDWDRYVRIRDGHESTASSIRHAGAAFDYANLTSGVCDGLHILAPDAELIKDCDMNDDVNDGSYVVLYRSEKNRILFPGDAHDKTWDYIHANCADDVRYSSFLLAPHHGRDSDRSYDFLDWTQPGLTLIGCCPSEYIDYNQWTRRGLDYVTSNQCGNVVLEVRETYLAVYVENLDFVVSRTDTSIGNITCNSQGYGLLTTVAARDSAGEVLREDAQAVGAG